MPVNFPINPAKGIFSDTLSKMGIQNFQAAADWVSKLPYRRNEDKDNKQVLFEEKCGTCSTKHALLKRLADENENTGFKLILGIFKMNARNTPAVEHILKRYHLDYIPEAHNYLRIDDQMLDYTGIGIDPISFVGDLLNETEIDPDQITDFKVAYHRSYLTQWIEKEKIPYPLDALWQIREECIRAIALDRLAICTDRLLLRPFRKEDGAIMYALNEDIAVLQYTGDTQFTSVEATEAFLEKYDQYEKYSVGRMMAILKETGEVLGWCGLKYHPETDEYDIGYRFFKRHWGKGYATESAQATLADGFRRLGIRRVVGRARVENTASIHVFDKLDMRFVMEFKEDGQNWVLYEINR